MVLACMELGILLVGDIFRVWNLQTVGNEGNISSHVRIDGDGEKRSRKREEGTREVGILRISKD